MIGALDLVLSLKRVFLRQRHDWARSGTIFGVKGTMNRAAGGEGRGFGDGACSWDSTLQEEPLALRQHLPIELPVACDC